MASRVNVKFAIALAAGVFLIGGAAITVAYLAVNKTGDEYVNRGDAALAQGDLRLAAQNYEKAVGHDRTRIDWLEKWRSVLVQLTPETQFEYERSFDRHYLGILEQMAVLKWDDPAQQRALIDARYERVATLFPTNVTAWQSVTTLVEERTERLDSSSPEARSLKRYRGLSILSQMALTDVEQNLRDEGLADLRAAAEADPSDVEVARGVVLWHTVEWRRAFLDRRAAEARRIEQQLDQELDAFDQAFPEHPSAQLAILEVALNRIATLQSEEGAQRAAMRNMLGQEAPVVETFQNASPDMYNSQDLSRLHSALVRVGSPDRLNTVLELIERISDDDAIDPQLTVLHAEVLGGLRRFDEAIAVIQDYLAEPIRPLSLEGLVQRYFRPQALVRLADQALAKWETVETSVEKDAALEIAKDAQRQLNETTQGGEQSPEALNVRGKLAQAEGRTEEAVRIFTELVEKIGVDDPDTRWRLAQSLRASRQLGAARAQLRLILDDEPGDLRALLSLADIHALLKEEEQARAVLQTVRDLYPQLAEINQIERQLDAMLETDPETSKMRTIIAQSRALRSDQSPEGFSRARQIVSSALRENPDSIEYAIELVDIETMSGQVAEARRILTTALTYNPNSPHLVRLDRALQTDDPYAAAIALIEDSELSAPQKLVRQHLLAKRHDNAGDAEGYLDRLRNEYADNPMVLDLLFTNSLRERNLDEARRLVTRAVNTNADQANGLIYQGRLDIVEDNHEAAARNFRQAREILPFNSQLLLLLGQTELRLGNVGEGLRALQNAYEGRPDDATVATRYLRTLRELQRNDDALEVARAASRLNPMNLELLNAWLELEASHGDPQVALSERQRVHELFPADDVNTLALAGLLIKSERWDDANALISAIEAEGATIESMLMRARITALRDGVDEGQRVIDDFLAEHNETAQNAGLQLALAEFLLEFGEDEKAIEVLRNARGIQSKELMEVDRQLGDYAFNAGNLEEAITHYERILEATADPNGRVAMRLAETYSKLGRFEDAEAMLSRVEGSSEDLTSLLIRARNAASRGDDATARRLFDQAVEASPNDPNPFLQRAAFNLKDNSQFNDALADVDQAIRLQPDLVSARQMKAEMLSSRGRASEAIAEIRRALQSDPESDELRRLLIQLLVAENDFNAAISIAERAINERDDVLFWTRAAGDLNARAAEVTAGTTRARDYWKAAADHYERLYEANPDDSSKLRLANARLLQQQPDADQALELIESMEKETLERGDITILRARALYAVGRQADATTASRESLDKVTNNLQLRIWFDQLEQMLGSPLETGRFAEGLTAPEALSAQYELQTIVRLTADVSRLSELLERFRPLSDALSDREDLVDYYRYRGRVEFQLEQYEAAATSFASGLEHAPQDLEFNNNLAYVRSEFLGDAEGAIEPARRAAASAPQNATILDTMGRVYFKAGRLAEAQQALQNARQFASAPAEYIPIEIHLSEVFLEKNDRPQAIRLYQSARDRLADAPGLTSLYGESLESLRVQLDQAE